MANSSSPPNATPPMGYDYQVGGSLPVDAPTYVRRQADDDLYAALRKSMFCYVLNSRQMGKSSLKVQTMQRLQSEGVACAAIDLTQIGTSDMTPEQWYISVIDSIVSSLDLYETFDLYTWWEEHHLLSVVRRFDKFLEEVLLSAIPQPIVVFIDEIDSILSLPFKLDDFFALIRECYNRRAAQPDYNRLTFTLLGVTTPSDLMQDKHRTPFNIGYPVELMGFQEHESQSLAQGLAAKASVPQMLIQAVLDWTGGQPFLTQKVCKLVLSAEDRVTTGQETAWVEALVRTRVIENWEAQDTPEHLKTIRDRLLLSGEERTGRLLGLYQQIVQQEEVVADDSPEQMEMRLTGLVVKRDGKLKVYNRIYGQVFNHDWLEQSLAKLRPYGVAIAAWLESDQQDDSRLLRGQALRDARIWAEGKSLGDDDRRFLDASQELEKRDIQMKLAAEQKANQILTEAAEQVRRQLAVADRKVKRRTVIGSLVLATSLVLAGIAGVGAITFGERAKTARQAIQLDRSSVVALRLFELDQFSGLFEALRLAKSLQSKFPNSSLAEYPTGSPLVTLNTILSNIQQKNQIKLNQNGGWSASFSPDGQLLATAGADGSVCIWTIAGKLLYRFHAHLDGTKDLAFPPDGQGLITVGEDGALRVWSISGQLKREFTDYGAKIYSLSTAGNRVAIAGERGIWLINLTSGKRETLSDPNLNLDSNDVSFSPDGRSFAVGGADGVAYLYDVSGQLKKKFSGYESPIHSVAFSPDGTMLLTAGQDRKARLWDIAYENKPIATLSGHERDIFSASFSSDGEKIVTSSWDGTARVWSISGQQLTILRGHISWIGSAQFSRNDKTVLTTGFDDTARVWNWESERSLESELVGHQAGYIKGIDYTQNGQRIATSGDTDGTVIIWNQAGQEVDKLQVFPPFQDLRVLDVSFNLDGTKVAIAAQDGKVRIWDLSTRNVQIFQGHSDWINTVSFSPDGRFIITASRDGTAKIWNLSEQKVQEFGGHDSWVNDAVFSPDGQIVATAASNGKVYIWNSTGKLIHEFVDNNKGVHEISFSPDGKKIATAGYDRKARIRSVSGELIEELLADLQWVETVAFSPDGLQLATGGADGVVKLWSLTGQQIAALPATKGQGVAMSISFSPDGKQLATGGEDGVGRIWWIKNLDELLSSGCRWVNDYLTYNLDVDESDRRVCGVTIKK